MIFQLKMRKTAILILPSIPINNKYILQIKSQHYKKKKNMTIPKLGAEACAELHSKAKTFTFVSERLGGLVHFPHLVERVGGLRENLQRFQRSLIQLPAEEQRKHVITAIESPGFI